MMEAHEHKHKHKNTRTLTASLSTEQRLTLWSFPEWHYEKKILEKEHSLNVECWLLQQWVTELLSSEFKIFPSHFFFFSFLFVMFPAGADATETSCQPVETEHGLKMGVFPKGKLPQESTHNCMSCKHRSMEEWEPLRISAFAVTGDVVANNERNKLWTAAQRPHIETYLFMTMLIYFYYFFFFYCKRNLFSGSLHQFGYYLTQRMLR